MKIVLDKQDYEKYFSYTVSLKELSQKYKCSYSQITYALKLFCVQNNLPNRRQFAQQNRISSKNPFTKCFFYGILYYVPVELISRCGSVW